MQFIFGERRVVAFHDGAAVRQACHHAHHHRNTAAFGKFETIPGHVVGLLLVAGFEHRNHCEIGIEAGILLVLRRMHGGIVGRDDQQTAVGSGHGRIHERIGRHVQAHMLHRRDGPLAAVRHAQSTLHGRLLIARPMRVQSPGTRHGVLLHKFKNFGGRSSRIGIRPGQASVDSAQSQCFVTQQQTFSFHIVRSKVWRSLSP